MLERLSKKIETRMRDQGHAHLFSLEFLLYLVSQVYKAGVKLRQAGYENGWLQSKKLPCMVISVGNLTVGGTGKTPLVIYLSRTVQQLGYKVAVVSRGYKGAAEKRGAIVSDGHSILCGPDIAGDEPYMLAATLKNIPVLVGRRRFEAGMIAVETFDPDVIILDDAFQHRRLARDLDLVLLDAERPFGNGHLLPRGILREPLSGIGRADAIILTRAEGDVSATLQRLERAGAGRPIFRSYHVPEIRHVIEAGKSSDRAGPDPAGSCDLKALRQVPVLAFSGIAGNNAFREMLIGLGLIIKDFMAFPDHHDYSAEELALIPEKACRAGSRLVVTTEKDFVKIGERIDWPVDLAVLGIDTAFGADTGKLTAFIRSRLEGRKTEKG